MKRWLSALAVNLCRLALGVTYVASGMSKALDPAGMEHKVAAYLRNWDILLWTEGTAWLTAMVIALAATEFMLGMWLLIGMRRRLTTRLVTLFTAVFTILTIYIYIKEPVPDCGCFGDAVKLSHGETLLKNVVLLALCVPPLLRPLKIVRLIRQDSQWMPSLYAAAFVTACGIYSSSYTPLVDFTSYVPGYSFNAAMEGKFGEKGIEDAFNFAVLDTAENDITPDVILGDGYTFLAIATNLERTDRSVSDCIAEIHERAETTGEFHFYFLTASDEAAWEKWKDATDATYSPCHTDEGVLHTAAKTDPGLLLLHADTIVGKWTKNNLPTITDRNNLPVPVQKLTQKPQKTGQKLLKIAAWLFIPVLFLIFADSLAAGTVTLRRRSLKRLARARINQPATKHIATEADSNNAEINQET